MTPAEELTAAADRLDALLADTSDCLAPWQVDALHRGVYAADGSGEWVAEGYGDVEPYIAAMNPDVGRALARMLRRHGMVAQGWTDIEEVFPEELDLARAILATKEGT